MARLTDPTILAKFRRAFSQWRFTGYVTWKPIARQWVEQNLEGWTTRAVAEELCRFLDRGGEIDQTPETRSEWRQWQFHYDFRIEIGGRLLYIEALLIEDDPEDPVVHAVSVHLHLRRWYDREIPIPGQGVSLAVPRVRQEGGVARDGAAYGGDQARRAALYTVEVPRLRVPRCEACGEMVFENGADEQIAAALRKQLGLLSCEQIRANREQLGLSQRDLSDHLGVAVETISRWENGVLTQTRAMDRYLRVYFGVPAARAALVEEVVHVVGNARQDISGGTP